jgi:transposase
MAEMKVPPKRARYRRSLSEKLAIVRESMKGETSVAQVARRHAVSPNVLFYWRRVYRELVDQDLTAVAQRDALADLELQVRNLERLLGQRTLEIALLKERLGIDDDHDDDDLRAPKARSAGPQA